MRHYAAAAALMAVAPLAACSGSETAIDLRLVPDQAINDEAQILSIVDTFELVLDAAEGFAGVTAAGPAGDFVAEQTDKDTPLELVLRRDLRQAKALPRLRLVPGTNATRPFKLTARGRASGELAAASSAAARFTAGQTTDLVLPFNLRASFRAPRVVITLPHDGESSVPPALDGVYVEFSKLVAEQTVRDNLRLIYQGTAGEVQVETIAALGRKQVTDLGLAEERSTATLSLPCTLNDGTYRIEADPAITDSEGRPLDHGPDGYAARFTVGSGTSDHPCATEEKSCTGNEECNPDPASTEGRQRFYCDFSLQPPRCVPLQDSCQGGVPCPDDYPICTETGDCVANCWSLGGYCNDPGYYCAQDGQCLPCDQGTGCDLSAEAVCQQACSHLCLRDPDGNPSGECENCLLICYNCWSNQCAQWCSPRDNGYLLECENCLQQCAATSNETPPQ